MNNPTLTPCSYTIESESIQHENIYTILHRTALLDMAGVVLILCDRRYLVRMGCGFIWADCRHGIIVVSVGVMGVTSAEYLQSIS